MLEAFDATLLARLQFAFTVSFHFIFPSFSIGLASYLAVLEALWLWTGRSVYLDLFKYWLKIFALAFAMGVVSGIVMSYQFGTNWSVFSDKAGPVDRAADGLRGADRLLPRGRLPGRHAVRHEPGRQGAAFRGDAGGRGRHLHLGLLDPVGQQLDADAGGLHHGRQRPVRAGRLAGHHLQSVLPLSPGPYGLRRLPDDGAGGRRGRRLASAARAHATTARASCSPWPWA